jgi:hypothetical protein
MSEIFVDTIRKTGGSLGTDIRIKNTSVYESDGGTSVTQNLVQGLAKSWTRFNGSGTVAMEDSLNGTSLTDHGTGQYSYSFTNAMANANYLPNMYARDESYDRAIMVHGATGGDSSYSMLTTSALGGFCTVWTGGGNWSAGTDTERNGMCVHGDLA